MLITKQKTGTKWAACGILIALLAGCAGLDLGEETSNDAPNTVTNLVERDIEAPDVVNISEAGLWDGRPSLGGIWVAHPDAKDPEKVIIRNPQNGKFVIGALFRREREFSGPSLQLSSDAADALGILAGQPTNVSVVALRRQSVLVEKAENQVIEESLDPIQQTAEAAIAAADTPTPKPKPSSLGKPYLQIGIFGVEANARGAVSSMSAKGLSASMSKLTLNDKPFWRVIVGPAATTAEMSAMRKTVTAAGFADAYAVKN
ncbi:MAG: SPOR domain-containing protein [Rhodobacteraceae bacterium]|jgi:cell division septation protein DedD|nr:SPOR domain-containing protein [Paracoccaceae bacterium]